MAQIAMDSTKENQNIDFYGAYLTPKLRDAMKRGLDAPRHKQLDLVNELALFRAAAGEAIGMYGKAADLPDTHPRKNDFLNIAAVAMNTALSDVVRVCEAAARVDSIAKDKFSLNALHDVANQVVELVHQCFSYDDVGLQMFDQLMEERLRLPSISERGTRIAPDDDVLEMDSTIPLTVEN